MSTPSKPTEVEGVKTRSRHLRGSLVESLADPLTGQIAADDTHVIKFHGSYQQDDRDLREERRLQKLEPAWSFMLRTRLPGGIATPAQWLLLDELGRQFGNGTLRLTTRQAFQIHGILKRDLKPTMQGLHRALLDTFAACGDVNRNVMCHPNPVDSRVHADVHGWAVKLSEHLLPLTQAYSEIWLDGEPVVSEVEPVEPIYGATYLPRKFKIAIAVPPDNDVDVFAHDLGYIAVVDDGVLRGFNVTIGGGMGATHGDASTHPRLADVIGFVTPDQVLSIAEHVVGIQRDWGDRTNRKHARLKYTIEDRGLDVFVKELEQRSGIALAPVVAFDFVHNGDRFGLGTGHDGAHHLTLHIESGRLHARALDGLREIAGFHRGDFRLTANQNLIIAGIVDDDLARIQAIVAAHDLDTAGRQRPVKNNALACVALPTCALAMAEAERALPDLTARLETLLVAHGVPDVPFHFRVTGCPNGCARPYLAEVALIGKAPGRYNLHVGGDRRGQRLNRLHTENIDVDTVVGVLDGLLARFVTERSANEDFGDWSNRTQP